MAKKEKTAKLPKRLAGVKIPKALRNQGHHIAALARHPLVADIIAAGLVALAASLRDNPKVKQAAAKTKDVAGDVAEAAAAVVKPEAKPAAEPKPAKPAAKPKPKAAKPAKAAEAVAKKPAPRAKSPRRAPAPKTTH